MKSIFRKSLCLLMVLCFVLFGLSFVKVKVYADTVIQKTTVLDGRYLTGSATTAVSTITSDKISYTLSAGAKQQSSSGTNKFTGTSSAILIGKSGAYIYNNTAFGTGITKFELYSNSGASTKVSVGVMFSVSPITSYSSGVNTYTAILSSNNTVYDCSSVIPAGAKYFWYQVTNANNSQIQLKITYNKLPTISFDGNNGIGEDPNEITANSDGTTTALPTNPYTKTGFVFKEWNTKADGTGTSYDEDVTLTGITDDITLYAIWELDSANNVIVTFNSNTGTSSTTSTQGVEKNVATALNANTFTNRGMAFIEWNTEPDGTGTAYAEGASVTINDALTLYAQWSTYSIASIISNGVVGQTYFVQGEITAICKTTDAYIQDSTGAILIYDYASITNSPAYVTGNTVSFLGTLATYNELPQLKSLKDITVVNNDTIVNIAPLTSASDVTVANNRKYIELNEIKLNTVSSKSATINGADYSIFYDGENYVSGKDNLVEGTYVNIKGVVSTTATTKKICVTSIEKCTQYSLVFNMDGGKAISPQYVLAGNKFTAPTAPTKAADTTHTYEFAGWYEDSTLQTPFDFNTVYSEDKVAYAKWDVTTVSQIQQDLNTINAYMSLAYTYDFTSQSTYKYMKVTDASTLKAGDKLLLTCDSEKAYATGFNSTYISTSKYTDTPIYENEYVLTLGGEEGAWTLKSKDGLLGVNSSKDLNTNGENVTTWTITITNGYVTITSTTSANGVFKYNSDVSRIKTYASNYSGKSLNLYKQVADKVINSSDFRIRCGIDALMEDVVEGYTGATYGIEVSDGATTKKYLSTDTLYYTDDQNCDYVIIDLGDCLTNTARLSTKFTVRAFVVNEGTTYYSNQTKTLSVIDLLNTYYNNDATKALVSDLNSLLYEMDLLD